ncbi:MAG: PEP-CTERM sorting domain-containing protein [Akkermansiaceae bacterium]|nr:PEP-CTERM sorting domain-containing protein [Akkermansiaceae bacterium]
MTPENTTYTSMRASGIMFEYVAPIPEASSTVLLGLAAGLLLRRRRG